MIAGRQHSEPQSSAYFILLLKSGAFTRPSQTKKVAMTVANPLKLFKTLAFLDPFRSFLGMHNLFAGHRGEASGDHHRQGCRSHHGYAGDCSLLPADCQLRWSGLALDPCCREGSCGLSMSGAAAPMEMEGASAPSLARGRPSP